MELLKKIYLYIFSAIGLILLIIGAVELIDLGLRAYVFTQADVVYQYPLALKPIETSTPDISADEISREKVCQQATLVSTRQRQAANALALIIVGAPLFVYHWRLMRKNS